MRARFLMPRPERRSRWSMVGMVVAIAHRARHVAEWLMVGASGWSGLAPTSIDQRRCRPAACVASHPGTDAELSRPQSRGGTAAMAHAVGMPNGRWARTGDGAHGVPRATAPQGGPTPRLAICPSGSPRLAGLTAPCCFAGLRTQLIPKKADADDPTLIEEVELKGCLTAKNITGEPKPARYVPSAAIFAGNQDHIGLDVSPIAASTPSPIFSWRCSRFHERSENQLSAGGMQSNQTKMPTSAWG